MQQMYKSFMMELISYALEYLNQMISRISYMIKTKAKFYIKAFTKVLPVLWYMSDLLTCLSGSLNFEHISVMALLMLINFEWRFSLATAINICVFMNFYP